MTEEYLTTVPFSDVRVGDVVRLKFSNDNDAGGKPKPFLAEVMSVKDLPCDMGWYHVADNIVISFRRLHDEAPNARRLAREQEIGITDIDPYESCSTFCITKIVTQGPVLSEPPKPVNIYFAASLAPRLMPSEILELAGSALAGVTAEVRRPISYRRLRAAWKLAGHPGRLATIRNTVSVDWDIFAPWVRAHIPTILMSVAEYEQWKMNFNRHGADRQRRDYDEDMRTVDRYISY
jgi:hypothetical protein